jgi:hypothetical protein
MDENDADTSGTAANLKTLRAIAYFVRAITFALFASIVAGAGAAISLATTESPGVVIGGLAGFVLLGYASDSFWEGNKHLRNARELDPDSH